ncbi:MBL fold metallo-hydrolase [Paraburkholderia hospita]|uniref:MBL fold metallo-hydrolase n=1 Tax=Paraburkholderia hospita TaxID=169430 RepID=UPI003ED04599
MPGSGGGIGAGLHTTAMLLESDVLIDAGTGVGDLSIEALSRIDAVFLTHSHLDHLCLVPFVANTVGQLRLKPLTISCGPISRHCRILADLRRLLTTCVLNMSSISLSP